MSQESNMRTPRRDCSGTASPRVFPRALPTGNSKELRPSVIESAYPNLVECASGFQAAALQGHGGIRPTSGPTVRRFAELACRLRIHPLLGSFNERDDEPARCDNTSVLFGPDGSTLAAYREIHLFDFDVSEAVRCFESECVAPGERPVVVVTPPGLSICYLRIAWQGPYGCLIPCQAAGVARFGRIDEWHLLVAKAFKEITFGLPPWFSEKAIVFGSAFSETRFIPIRSVSNAMDRDGVEQLVVKAVAER
jgi:hypothetical protein